MKKVKYIFKEIKRPTAEWKWDFASNGWADTVCSHCGFTSNNDVHVHAFYPFCPNCGAKMANGCKRVYYECDGTIRRYKKWVWERLFYFSDPFMEVKEMYTEQYEQDILDYYRDGFSRTEIKEMYEGIDPHHIDDICDEEDHTWFKD